MKKNIICSIRFLRGVIRTRHFATILFFDLLLLILAHFVSYLLRFEGVLDSVRLQQIFSVLPLIFTVKLPIFYAGNLYRGMWRFTSFDEMRSIIKSVCVSSALLVTIILFLTRFDGLSRSVFILDSFFTFLFIGGLRIAIRYLHDQRKHFLKGGSPKNIQRKKLLLLGAGESTEKIIRELKDNPQLPYQIIGLLDDDLSKRNKQIHHIRVLGTLQDLLEISRQTEIDELLISVASASSKQMKRMIRLCKETGLPYKAIPGLANIINGQVSIKAIRDISYEDLLGRSEVKLAQNKIGRYLTDKVVMVTGGGGSIGSELCRQILKFNPGKIIVFDAGEENLYSIQMELMHEYNFQNCVPVLGQIQDLSLTDKVMQDYKPEVIFHAAAYKHVPLLELNPWEAVENNIIGTQCIMEAAIQHQVRRFVLVSTDKAVRPTNVMGASKRIAELLMQAYSLENWDRKFHRYLAAGIEIDDNRKEHATTFMAVRFGNVLGSSGSVIPLFKRQIELGGPVTVTHPDITRYFMSIPEAAQLILQAGSMANGGEIFILKMGQPVRIAELARELIIMLGKEPDSEIEIKYIGLREGEKLYEELITEGEGIVKTNHEKIMVLRGEYKKSNIFFLQCLKLVQQKAQSHDSHGIKEVLLELLPEYSAGNRS
ncbi:NDP-sugar epimerase [Candidatus Electrothrix aarhusensis]|uniref:NDP-sugar epimerase n=1 Tax=Candidatus Electrothrix aarhusensis TaxID=1859131 RepID=A0A444IW67_9BACT|nr:NDP-sugar epimerase [Candidatus Electrothrix aarhusensis]